jgi:hypothetical protein
MESATISHTGSDQISVTNRCLFAPLLDFRLSLPCIRWAAACSFPDRWKKRIAAKTTSWTPCSRRGSGISRPALDRCRQVGKFRRRHKQKAYSCVACGHDIYPLVGTIFEGSKTPFSTWLAAAELVHVFKASAKEIQRQTGVNYKTAWRMKTLLPKLPSRPHGSTADLKDLMRWLISHPPA